MKLPRALILPFLLVPILFMPWTEAFSQASKFEMQFFPMPPNKGFAGEKHFRYAGDYYYPYSSDYAVPRVDDGSDAYAYYRYTGVFNKNINVWPLVANISDVADPRTEVRRGRTIVIDACSHTHLSYGIWVKYRGTVHFGSGDTINASGYNFMGGGGMSGVRNSNGRCVHRSNNPLRVTDERFGWGNEFTSFTPTYGDFDLNIYGSGYTLSVRGYATEVIIGVTAPSHGWDTCGEFLCYNPVRPYVWTLRP